MIESLSCTRRALLLAAGATALPRFVRAAAPAISVQETRIISFQPEFYHGWPTLARCRAGRLLLTWSGGREAHICPFGRVEMMTSDDAGASWTWPRTLLDSATDDRDSGVLETATGALLVTTFTSLAYESLLAKEGASPPWKPERLRAWKAAQARLSAEGRRADLGQWVIRSADAGVTWSARIPTLVNSPHGPIQLRDGRLLYAGKELWTGAQRNGIAISEDDGQTWRWLSEIPTRAGDRAREYHELHAVETADDRLIVHLRNHNSANQGETLQCESADGGQTWSDPHPIGVWGLPSHLLRLGDGRLLMTYGQRRPPFGNQARLSEDHGRTWSAPLPISEDGATGDLGYPSTVELSPNSFLTVWYESRADSPRAVLRQARWTVS